MNNFKNIVSKKRKELNMTQRDLAKKLNVSDKTISKWETGVSYPEITLLKTLANVLELDVNELLEVNNLQANIKTDDNEKISKFKNTNLLIIGLILIGYLISIMSFQINNNDLRLIFIIIGMSLIVITIFIFMITLSNFKTFYKDKFETKKYDYLYFKYFVVILNLYLIPLLTLAISVNNYLVIFLFMFFILVLLILLITIVMKTVNIKIKKDKINIGLLILIGLLFVSIYTNVLPTFSSTILLLIVSNILYLIIIHRNYYTKE